MAEILIAVVAKLAEYMVYPVVHQGKYFFCVGKITKTLEIEKKELISLQERMLKRVDEATKKTEKIEDAVEKWLGEVKDLLDELEKLEQQMKEDKGCFQRCFNWKKHGLCKQMAKKTTAVKELIESSEFKQFSTRAALPDIEYFSSGNFIYFQSTRMASDKLLEAFQDDGSYMIGLYGMGGSGKTTLAKEVGKQAKELKLFDRVVFTTVSQTPDIRKIQGEIADLLDSKLDEETEAGRARRLSIRMSSGERILIILDDVWEKINLEDIGIPIQDNCVGCKVLLTTRRQQVCNTMDCEKKIPLNLLSEEETWALFQKHARIGEDVFNLLSGVARDVARECKGLPIAIAAVGTSLKGKSVEEWKEALRRLKDSEPTDVEGGEDAFPSLKLSYDFLKSKKAKSLFLMCSMFPEDHDIFIDDLFRIAVGLGLCKEMDSLEMIRNDVKANINNLIDSCLLMRSENKVNHLRMHDVVRAVALWIATEENQTIVVNLVKDLNVLAEVGAIKDCYAFTSWCNEIACFHQQLIAPKLEILLLQTRYSLNLSESSFEAMKALKVVAMVNQYSHDRQLLTSLPQSMQWLTNLQTLRLRGWELGDISWVVGLTRLHILDLNGSSFKELPNGLKELKKLKLLDLKRCVLKKQCFEVIRRCTQLEELYASKIASTVLEPHESFQDDNVFPKLQRYALQIGRNVFSKLQRYGLQFSDFEDFSRILSLERLNISATSSFIKHLLQHAEYVFLHWLYGGCKNIVPDMVRVVGGMNELANIRLHQCSYFECLVDTTYHIDLLQGKALFPKLIKLELAFMGRLKEVCHGPPLPCIFEKLQELDISRCTALESIFLGQMTFSNLKIMKINSCPMLTSLFPMSVARTMLLLQELTIESCLELKHIIEEDDTGTRLEIIPVSNISSLVFPRLKILTIWGCDKLEFVFPNSCVQGLEQLEEVNIQMACQLKYIFGQHEDEHNEIQIKLPLLELIRLKGLKNLLGIFPKYFHSSCPSLRDLQWDECPRFDASCVNIMVGSDMNMASTLQLFLKLEKLAIINCSLQDILFPLEGFVSTNIDQQNKLTSSLFSLNLMNLDELKFVWSGPQTLSFQNLRDFHVSNCNGLKAIFSPTILRSLQQLEKLSIVSCNELEKIISDTEVEEQHQNPLNAHPPQICFPNLKSLGVIGCNKLKCLFSVAMAWDDLPELEYLHVEKAAHLKEVFGGKVKQNNSGKMIPPKLKHLKLIEVPSLSDFKFGYNLTNVCLPQASSTGASHESSEHHKTEVLIQFGYSFCFQQIGIGLVEGQPELVELKLETLTLECFPQLRSIWTAPSQILGLPYLRSLKVYQCRKLKYIFSTVIHGSLPVLRRVSIWQCEELEEIFAEFNEQPHDLSNMKMCFPKLEILEVHKCNKLKRLFSTAAVRIMLPKLDIIRVSEAAQLEELFNHESEEGTVSGEQIVLPNLEVISLEKLPSLTEVCRGSKLYAVNLGWVTIRECPNLYSTTGATQRNTEGHWPLAMTCGSQLCNGGPSLIPATSSIYPPLTLKNCGIINILSLGEVGFAGDQHEILNLRNLCGVELTQCPKLKSVFSTVILRCLPMLESLVISECEELEEIMAEIEEPPNPSNNSQIFLPRLRKIEVKRCNKLRFLFPITVAKMLPKLNTLHISEAAQLREVFTHKSEEGTSSSTEEIMLPSLETIELTKLPLLVDVCQGFKLQAVKLSNVKINDCPNFHSIVSTTEEIPVQLKAEISYGQVSSEVSFLKAASDINEDDGEDEENA